MARLAALVLATAHRRCSVQCEAAAKSAAGCERDLCVCVPGGTVRSNRVKQVACATREMQRREVAVRMPAGIETRGTASAAVGDGLTSLCAGGMHGRAVVRAHLIHPGGF